MAEDFASKLGLVAPSSGGGDFASKLGLVKVEPKPEQPGVFGKIWGDIKGAGQQLATDVMAEPDKPSNPFDISAATAKGGRILRDVANVPLTAMGSAFHNLVSEPVAAGGQAAFGAIGGEKFGRTFPSAHDIDLATSAMRPAAGGLPRLSAIPKASAEDIAADKAGALVRKRFGEDEKAGGMSATDALDKINKSSKPLALVDLGGENVKGLAGNVGRQPGTARAVARETMQRRDEGAMPRLDADISKYVSGGPSMFRATEDLLAERSAAAKPQYEATRSLEAVWSPRLQEFLNDPALKSGMARGYEIERLDSLAEGRPFDPTQLGADLDEQGNVRLLRTPNMRVLDMGKRGLDAMIADERNTITGRLSARGVALDKVRRTYLGELDSLDTTGTYRKARESWSGHSASLDAIRSGRGLFSASPEEIAADFRNLSPGDQEFYRLGVADILRERLNKAGFSSDEAKAILKNPWTKRQLQPIFRSEKEFDQFIGSVTDEQTMFNTRREVLGGSQTRTREMEDTGGRRIEDVQAGAHILSNAAQGNFLGAAIRAWRLKRDIGLRPDPLVNEQVARMLFTPNLTKMAPMAQRITGTFKPPQGAQPPSLMGRQPPLLPPGVAPPPQSGVPFTEPAASAIASQVPGQQ